MKHSIIANDGDKTTVSTEWEALHGVIYVLDHKHKTFLKTSGKIFDAYDFKRNLGIFFSDDKNICNGGWVCPIEYEKLRTNGINTLVVLKEEDDDKALDILVDYYVEKKVLLEEKLDRIDEILKILDGIPC